MSVCMPQGHSRRSQFVESCVSFGRKETQKAVPSKTQWAMLKTVRIWISRRQQRIELANLDERMLKDIGCTPQQAKIEVQKPFWM